MTSSRQDGVEKNVGGDPVTTQEREIARKASGRGQPIEDPDEEVEAQLCPECGGQMCYERHDDVLEYKGQKRTVKTLGWWCSQCGEGILSGKPLLEHERAFLEWKAEVDCVRNEGS